MTGHTNKKHRLGLEEPRLACATFWLIFLANLTYVQLIFAAYVHILNIDPAAMRYFLTQGALAGIATLWFALRIARYPRFLSYRDGIRVYLPCMVLSLALPVGAAKLFSLYWGTSGGVLPLLLSGGVFFTICLSIKLHSARHAFSYSLTE